MRPWVSISAHQTPRWPRQMRSLFSGSGMRFGNDDMLDAGGVEIAPLRHIGDAAIAAGFLIRRGGNLDGADKTGMGGDEGLRRDDRGRKPALHVAGTAPVDLAILQLAAEGILRPAVADGDDMSDDSAGR